MCPLRCNTFVIPPASLVLIAFATAGRFDGATTLAKVLFWIGAPATLALALYLAAARWITEPRSSEHINPAWLLPPTACFVCALVAPFLDPRYTEAAYLWFAAAVALALPTYVITFQRAVLFQEPDDRNRPLKWTWVSAWAVACAAQVVLAAATGPTGERRRRTRLCCTGRGRGGPRRQWKFAGRRCSSCPAARPPRPHAVAAAVLFGPCLACLPHLAPCMHVTPRPPQAPWRWAAQ